ncbi:MAG TPA: alginate export family protein [Candidatus Omnitrophota bacterium]|nr:alginate export family protein [Candidatus Omnitrophota bacterium]
MRYKNLLLSIFFVFIALRPQARAGEFLNQHLPSYLKADIEYRYRLEYKNNFDFDKGKDDTDAYNLFRTRVNLNYSPLKPISFFIQTQDARVSNLSAGAKSLMENFWDIRQLYARYENAVLLDVAGLNKLYFQAGRQEFLYGAQRLIGGFDWSNVAQTFDGGKAGFHFAPFHLQLDIFAGDKAAIKSPREADDLFDGSSKDRVYAYYATARAFHETLIENYFIHRTTWENISFGPNGSGEVDHYTFGGRLKNKLPHNFDYEIETAGQWGNFNDQAVRALMAVGILGYTFDHKWQPRLAFEFDYGSGDSNPNDKKMTTFDNLYPANHPFYGYMDLMSLQNINDYRTTMSVKPNKKLKLQSDLHLLYLDTPKDSLYSAARTVTRTSVAGSSDVNAHVGNEVDLTADYKFNNNINFGVGYSHLFAGGYLKDTGANNDADFFYFQTIISL